MSTLIILGESDSPGKKDWSRAFLPEANALSALHTTLSKPQRVTFDNKLPFGKRAGQVLKRLAALAEESGNFDGDFDTVAIFCHGWGDGIQAGFTRRNVKRLVTALKEVGLSSNFDCDPTIILYCCSTGDDPDDDIKSAPGVDVGEGSFADVFRDELCKAGNPDCRVVAHTTAGHTTYNPYAIFFEGHGSPIGGVGGIMPVTPANKTLWRTWVKMLKTNFRFEYPHMAVGEIHERILAAKANV